nr:hypothetical protein [Tanacetum cinerariifolium]
MALLLFLLLLLSSSFHSSSSLPEYSKGKWKVLKKSIGVSAMHMALLPNDRIITFDRTDFGPSNITFPAEKCPLGLDCYAHSVEFYPTNREVRPLTILSDTWCSSGALLPNGVLIQSGGNNAGERVVRTFSPCDKCDWVETRDGLVSPRWYASNQLLPNGRVIVVGGKRQFTYEFIPKTSTLGLDYKEYPLPFLQETLRNDYFQNNLYPFLHLNTDGNLFIFANDRAILLDYVHNKVVRKYPVMPGGVSRNYPSTGSSVLLPMNLSGGGPVAEVFVCGERVLEFGWEREGVKESDKQDMAVVNNRVNEKHNLVLDDSGTASNRVNEGIGSPSTMASNNEPSFVVHYDQLMDSLGGKHNVESVVNPKLDTSQKIGFRALVTPAGNGADVVVSKESVCVVNEQLNNTVYGFFLVKRMAYPVVEKYVKTAWSKFSLVKSIMTKGVFFFKFSSKDGMESMLGNGACCKVFGHVLDECHKKPVPYVLKNLNNHRQAVRGIMARPKVGFKPTKQVYKLVSKNNNSANTCGKKKQSGLSRQYASNSNLFDALKSVENDDDLEMINNLERQMMDEKLMLVDGDGKPLNKVDYDPVNANSDSDSDIEVAYNETPQFMAGGGANDASLYEEEDYDIYDTYDIEEVLKKVACSVSCCTSATFSAVESSVWIPKTSGVELIEVNFRLRGNGKEFDNGKVYATMMAPSFTTHSFSMNQRVLVLEVIEVRQRFTENYAVT